MANREKLIATMRGVVVDMLRDARRAWIDDDTVRHHSALEALDFDDVDDVDTATIRAVAAALAHDATVMAPSKTRSSGR